MSYSPLVSIVTVVYNGEKYIEHTIRSVIDQSYKNIEYIVVDGGSKDNTVSIIKSYESHIAKWVSEKDEGISDAFNKGIAMATGEIVGIINADDWYEKDTVQTIVDNIRDYDIVYGDLQMWKGGAKDYLLKGDHTFLEQEMTVTHPTLFVKRECYLKYGAFDKSFKCAMDYDLALRFKVKGCTFKYVPAVLSNMRWDGVSDTRWLLGCKESLAIKNLYLPHRKMQNKLYFYKHVLAISIPKFLQKIKLDFIVRMYRARFSRIKKEYN